MGGPQRRINTLPTGSSSLGRAPKWFIRFQWEKLKLERRWKVRLGILLILVVTAGAVGVYYELRGQPSSPIVTGPVAGCNHSLNGNVTAAVTGTLYTDGQANYFKFNVTITNQGTKPVRSTGATLTILTETFRDGRGLNLGLSANVNPKNNSQTVYPGCDYVLYGPTLTLGNPSGGSYNGTYLRICEITTKLIAYLSSPPGPVSSPSEPFFGC